MIDIFLFALVAFSMYALLGAIGGVVSILMTPPRYYAGQRVSWTIQTMIVWMLIWPVLLVCISVDYMFWKERP